MNIRNKEGRIIQAGLELPIKRDSKQKAYVVYQGQMHYLETEFNGQPQPTAFFTVEGN